MQTLNLTNPASVQEIFEQVSHQIPFRVADLAALSGVVPVYLNQLAIVDNLGAHQYDATLEEWVAISETALNLQLVQLQQTLTNLTIHVNEQLLVLNEQINSVSITANQIDGLSAFVRDTTLIGLDLGNTQPVVAGITLLDAVGRLQRQITDAVVTLGNEIDAQQVALNNEINTRLAALVNASPATLDTLKELADALGQDPNFATTVTTALGTKLNRSGDTMAGALNWAPAVSVASAATTQIGLAASNLVTITGTTTITSFGSAAAGVVRAVTFAGALTLTHSGGGIILPGGVNITTAVNDTAVFQSFGGGVWLCTTYQKVNGQAVSVSPLPNTITKTVANPGASSFTARAGNHYLIWSPVTATLLASPVVGDTIYFTSHVAGWTIARNGNVISGIAEDLVVDIGGPGKAMKTFGLRFIEAGATIGWVII